LMAAMLARGSAARRSSAARNRPPTARASSGPPNSAMSAPAAKMRSPPHTTTAPGGSAWSSAATPANSSRSAADRALALGRSRRTRATPSSRRVRSTNTSISLVSVLMLEAAEHLLGGCPRVGGAGGDIVDQRLPAVLAHRGAHLAFEQCDEHPTQLGEGATGAAGLELPPIDHERPMGCDRVHHVVDPLALGGDGADDRRSPTVGVGAQVEREGNVALELIGERLIGLVDDENVGDFEQPGL